MGVNLFLHGIISTPNCVSAHRQQHVTSAIWTFAFVKKKEFEVLVFASRFLFRGAGHFMNARRPEAEIPSMLCRGAPKY